MSVYSAKRLFWEGGKFFVSPNAQSGGVTGILLLHIWRPQTISVAFVLHRKQYSSLNSKYEGWNFNSGNYLFTTDTE